MALEKPDALTTAEIEALRNNDGLFFTELPVKVTEIIPKGTKVRVFLENVWITTAVRGNQIDDGRRVYFLKVKERRQIT